MTSYKKPTTTLASAIVLSSCLFVNSVCAASFGFEDVTDTHTASGDFWTTGAGSNSTSSGGVTATISHNFYYNSQYDGYIGGAGVSASTSSDYNSRDPYAADYNTSKGGASKGQKYAVLFLPAQTNYAMTQYNYEYVNDAASGMLSYVTPVDGKNSKFDKTDSVGSSGGDFLQYTSVLFDQSVTVNSIDLSLTSILYNKLDYDGATDGYMDCTIHSQKDSFMTLRIYGVIDATTGELTDNYVDWVMAKYVDGTNDILVNGWETIALAALGVDVSGLAFQCISNIGGAYGITAPSYVAIDNITFNVPEPAEWAAIFGVIALGFAIYRRRK